MKIYDRFGLTYSGYILGLSLISASLIISSSYVGLNGNHIWRQADSYAQVLGFIGLKGLSPLEDFYGHKALYDIPVYQYIVANLARLTKSDPLVTCRFFNAGLWLSLIYGARRFSEGIKQGSSAVTLFLICTSPLLTHYYSTPIPDTLSLALGINAIAIFMTSSRHFHIGLLLIAVSALIKSPITFVLLVTYTIYYALQQRTNEQNNQLKIFILLFISAASAVSAELLRKLVYTSAASYFAQDPSWYFGTIDLRLSREFWFSIFDGLISSFSFPLIGWAFIVITLYAITRSRAKFSKNFIAPALGFMSGWLVFSNLYYRHDYYQIPVTILAYTIAGISWTILHKRIMGKLLYKFIYPYRFNLAIFFVASFLVYMPKISDLEISGQFDSMKYLLRDTEYLVWVNYGDNDQIGDGLPIGGLTMTKIIKISQSDFEKSCAHYINKYTSFLAKGFSPCLNINKTVARAFTNDSGYTFLLK